MIDTIKLPAATIAKLGLEPGDVIVLRVIDRNHNLTRERAENILESVKAACGDHQVIILPYGLEISKMALAIDDKEFGET